MTTFFGYMFIIIIMWVLYLYYKAPTSGWDGKDQRKT